MFRLPTRGNRNRFRCLAVLAVNVLIGLSSFCTAQFSTTIDLPADSLPATLQSDTQLNVGSGALLPRFYEVGDPAGGLTNLEVNFVGGESDFGLQIHRNAVVNIASGALGDGVTVGRGGQLTVTGGSVGGGMSLERGGILGVEGGELNDITMQSNSITNMSGGIIKAGLEIYPGARFELGGGTLAGGFTVRSGGRLTISGGVFGHDIVSRGGANVRIVGGEFRMRGEVIPELATPGSTLFIDEPRDLTGVLADGTPFVYESSAGFSRFSDIELESVALPPIGPATIDPNSDTLPLGLREGQSMTVAEGAVIPPHFRVGWGSEVRIESGAVVADHFHVGGGTVHITGGQIGDDFASLAESKVSISGGSFGNNFSNYGVELQISGGTFGENFDSVSPGDINVLGGEFELDGRPISGIENTGDRLFLDVPLQSVFSGVFADGTPFAFETALIDDVLLELVELPEIGPESLVASRDSLGLGIRRGQSLRIDNGGRVANNFNAGPGSIVQIEPGGVIGDNFEAIGAEVSISGGVVGDGFDVLNGSTVTISGGVIGDRVDSTGNGSTIKLKGADFRVNGQILSGLDNVGDQVTNVGALARMVTGILEDGTPIAFHLEPDDDDIPLSDFIFERTELPQIEQAMFTASTDVLPSGAREGQTIVVDEGGRIPEDFTASVGSTVILESGGELGDNFEAFGANVIINGGTVGDDFDAFTGTNVKISGGEIGNNLQVFAGSTIEFVGTDFLLDNQPVDGLVNSGDSVVISERDVSLSGFLSDGERIDFYLEPDFIVSQVRHFSPSAELRLVLAGADASLDCDFNGDGACNVSDIDALIVAIGTADPVFDINGDGNVGATDIELWLSSAGRENIGRPYALGDATLDGNVDAADLNVVGKNWQAAVSGWSNGDFTGDGIVNATDLNKVGQNWLRVPAATQNSVAKPVPEPSNTCLVGILTLVLLSSQRCACKS